MTNEKTVQAIANKQRQILDAHAKIAELEAEIETLRNPPVSRGDKVRIDVENLPAERDAFQDTDGLAEVIWTVGYVSPHWPTQVPLETSEYDGHSRRSFAMNIPISWLVKV